MSKRVEQALRKLLESPWSAVVIGVIVAYTIAVAILRAMGVN